MSRFLARLAVSIAAVLVMLVAAVIAVGFFAFAIYQLMLGITAPAIAAAATGFIVLILALLLVGATFWIASLAGRRERSLDASLEAAESAAELGSVIGRKLQGFAKAHRNGTLWAALIAGFVVGASPKLRAFLRDLLKS